MYLFVSKWTKACKYTENNINLRRFPRAGNTYDDLLTLKQIHNGC